MKDHVNPIEGIFDLIKEYTNEDMSNLLSAKEKLGELVNEDSIKKLFQDLEGNVGSINNLGQIMNVLPMVENVVRRNRDNTRRRDIRGLLEEILKELKHIRKCTCHKNHYCHKGNWEHWY